MASSHAGSIADKPIMSGSRVIVIQLVPQVDQVRRSTLNQETPSAGSPGTSASVNPETPDAHQHF
jgi:hypothetical protein